MSLAGEQIGRILECAKVANYPKRHMEKIRWRKSYDSGLVYLDNHRRNFLGIVNELIEASNEGVCENTLPMIFHRLAFYVEDYFVKKEMALRDNKSLPFTKYKESHDEFTRQIIIFQDRYRHGEMDICTEMVPFLIEWFEQYIELFDKEGASYLRSKGYE